VKNDDLCPMSDLPPEQCALPCHRNESLPAGADPEVVRGVTPIGVVHPLTAPAASQHDTRVSRPRARRPKANVSDCRIDRETGVWVTREHTRDCRSSGCEGCRPCSEDHCGLFGSCPHHVNVDVGIITCPAHIGEVKDLVADIVELTTLVHAELEHSSVSSEIANLAGPVVDIDQLDGRRRVIVNRDDDRGWCSFPRLELLIDDIHHPVAVFARWERDLRAEYGQADPDTGESERWPLPHRVERDLLARSAAYFLRMLEGRFPHDEQFETFARDMRRLRGYLEEVLSDSRRPDTGVPCPKCAEALDGTDQKAPGLQKRHDDSTKTMRDRDGQEIPDNTRDRWVCPDFPAEHWWTEADYRLRVAGDYLAYAENLTADLIQMQYGIPAGTVRRWANTSRRFVGGEWVEQPAQLRSVGRTEHGVRQYAVKDVLELRDKHQRQGATA
jgi:hypothetical protein